MLIIGILLAIIYIDLVIIRFFIADDARDYLSDLYHLLPSSVLHHLEFPPMDSDLTALSNLLFGIASIIRVASYYYSIFRYFLNSFLSRLLSVVTIVRSRS